ncbi:MAG: nucleotidyl transferase AbiEii/AbiGii toxin family protein [Hyphomicrobium sp.]
MRKPINIGASVRARLLNLARQRQQPFQVLLTRYVLERLLYRLSTTSHRDRFVLKGAMLLTSWFPDPLRPTQDLDLLGFDSSDASVSLDVFREVCAVSADDGVDFDVAGLPDGGVRERCGQAAAMGLVRPICSDSARLVGDCVGGFGGVPDAACASGPASLDEQGVCTDGVELKDDDEHAGRRH